MNISTEPISYRAAHDFLGHTAQLDAAVTVPLLGLPVRICSNSPSVIAAAERSFHFWHALPNELISPAAPLSVEIVVHQTDVDPPMPTLHGRPHFVFRHFGGHLLAAAGANILMADMDAGRSLAFVTPELVADDANLRYAVIECLALMLTAPRDRTPLHAGALMRNGNTVLLIAASGVGKSTLSYTAARAGMTLLAEDVVYASLEKGLRLWGNPNRIHLLPDAPRFFPELAATQPTLQANGKLKFALDAAQHGITLAHQTNGPITVCFLQRSSVQASRLEPLQPSEILAALHRPHEPGFDILAERSRILAEVLATYPGYRLHVGDPRSAVTLLDALLEG